MIKDYISIDNVQKLLLNEYSVLYRLDEEKNIFLVRDVNNEKYTCKIISKDIITTDKLKMLLKINHKNIAKIIKYKETKDNVIIIRQYIKGFTLYDDVKENGEYSEDKCIRVISILADALKYLHSMPNPLIFRDIHPKNIIIADGNNPIFIDIETVRLYQENKKRDTIMIGVLGFIAPEQYGFEQSSIQSDIYSLGMVAIYMFSGEYPNFNNNSPQVKELSISSRLKRTINKMTSFSKDKRFKNIDALMRKLNLSRKNYYIKYGAIVVIIFILILFVQMYYNSYKPLNEQSVKSVLKEDVTSKNNSLKDDSETFGGDILGNKKIDDSAEMEIYGVAENGSITEIDNEPVNKEAYEGIESIVVENDENTESLVVINENKGVVTHYSFDNEEFSNVFYSDIIKPFNTNWVSLNYDTYGLTNNKMIKIENIMGSSDDNYIYIRYVFNSIKSSNGVAFFIVEGQSGVFAKFKNVTTIGDNDYVLRIDEKSFLSQLKNKDLKVKGLGFDFLESSKQIVFIYNDEIITKLLLD